MRSKDNVCPKCNNARILEQVICGYCVHGIPHSSCDDTFVAEIACVCVKEIEHEKLARSFICQDQKCLYKKECANHETAGDFRSEDGFSPIVHQIGDKLYCETYFTPSIIGYKTYPARNLDVGMTYLS